MRVTRASSNGFPAVAFRRSPRPSFLVFAREARFGVRRLDAAFRARRVPNACNVLAATTVPAYRTAFPRERHAAATFSSDFPCAISSGFRSRKSINLIPGGTFSPAALARFTTARSRARRSAARCRCLTAVACFMASNITIRRVGRSIFARLEQNAPCRSRTCHLVIIL